MDNKIIQVALDGLENILKVGESDKEQNGGTNLYAQYVEEAGGMITIHNLQHHENLEIYKKCFYIMDKYFPEDDEAEVDTAQVNEAGGVCISCLAAMYCKADFHIFSSHSTPTFRLPMAVSISTCNKHCLGSVTFSFFVMTYTGSTYRPASCIYFKFMQENIASSRFHQYQQLALHRL